MGGRFDKPTSNTTSDTEEEATSTKGIKSDLAIFLDGGIININAEGDGIDSNGNLTITGGETYVCGPSNSGNGALDYGGTATISGGTLVAVGASGMALGMSDSSTQGSMLVNLSANQNAGMITLAKSSGA